MYFLKNLTLLSLVVVSLFACGSTASEPDNYTEVPWVSISDVESKINKKSKKVIVDVYTEWCGPCKMMDRNTFTDPAVIDVLGKKFYPVKFNAEGPEAVKFKGQDYANANFNPNTPSNRRNSPHDLARFFAVRGYPSLVIMDENLNIVEKIVGYKTPAQLLPLLEKY